MPGCPGSPTTPCIPVGPDGPVVTQSSSLVPPGQLSTPRLMPLILPLLSIQISIFSARPTPGSAANTEYRSGGRTDQPTPREFKRSRHVDALHFLFPSTLDDFRSRFHLSSPPRVPESEGVRVSDRVVHRPPHVHGIGHDCRLGPVSLDRKSISRQIVQGRGTSELGGRRANRRIGTREGVVPPPGKTDSSLCRSRPRYTR